MTNQYKPYIISDVSSDLIKGVGAVDRTIFTLQEATFWKEYIDNADLQAKWTGRAQESLAELEALVSNLRKQVEAL